MPGRPLQQVLGRCFCCAIRARNTHGFLRRGGGLPRIVTGKVDLAEFQPKVRIARVDANGALDVRKGMCIITTGPGRPAARHEFLHRLGGTAPGLRF